MSTIMFGICNEPDCFAPATFERGDGSAWCERCRRRTERAEADKMLEMAMVTASSLHKENQRLRDALACISVEDMAEAVEVPRSGKVLAELYSRAELAERIHAIAAAARAALNHKTGDE